MLSDIINAVNTIVDFIRTLVDFVVDFISDTVYVVGLLAETVVELPTYFGYFPTALVGIFITTFSIVVIYKILGREG